MEALQPYWVVSPAEEQGEGDELAWHEEGRRGNACSLRGCTLQGDEDCTVFLELLLLEELFAGSQQVLFVQVEIAKGFLYLDLRSLGTPAGVLV